ncbi:MAG TPA: hypothetical protein VI094_21840 [Propionibacteriaceae bacterium]
MTTVTIARQTVLPLLLVLAYAACGLGEDPLAGSSLGSASSPTAASNPPSPAPTRMPAPSSQHRTTNPAQASLPRGGRDVFPRYRYLSGLVKYYHLPENVMVYHQVARSVVRRESGLKDHDE